jgi:hypothetical protein
MTTRGNCTEKRLTHDHCFIDFLSILMTICTGEDDRLYGTDCAVAEAVAWDFLWVDRNYADGVLEGPMADREIDWWRRCGWWWWSLKKGNLPFVNYGTHPINILRSSHLNRTISLWSIWPSVTISLYMLQYPPYLWTSNGETLPVLTTGLVSLLSSIDAVVTGFSQRVNPIENRTFSLIPPNHP